MMFSRAASLRRFAAPAASFLRSSPLSTTVKPAPRKAAVPAPAAAAATTPQQAARDRPFPPHLDPAKVKRPTEIPFEPQFANTVHLVGTVGVLPVLEEKSPGECQAVSVIVEEKDSVKNDSLQLWIPVIFRGDLAQIAACHLRESDLVYIVGHLSGGEATTKVEDAHSKIRIFARSLSFVESNSQKDDKVASEQDKKTSDHSGNVKDESWWTDIFANSGDWNDNRIKKQYGIVNPRYPDFDHTSSRQGLWLNAAPSWVQPKLEGLKPFQSSDLTHGKDHDVLSALSENPGYPKEKEDDGRKTLLPNKKKDDLWKDVIENPTKWRDIRSNKRSPKGPDFKHIETGDVLWLDTSPKWVLEKLPPRSTTNSEDLWKDVIENPTNWWDSRLNKRNPKAPDFKHKESVNVLWLSSSPKWVLEKLPPAESPTDTESWAKAAILS